VIRRDEVSDIAAFKFSKFREAHSVRFFFSIAVAYKMQDRRFVAVAIVSAKLR
jgi:hypothetical protein